MAGPEPDRYRLSDNERDRALEQLRTALEEGRLDIDEHETRSTAALNAVTNVDLVPLFEDLPARLHPDSLTGSADTVPATRAAGPVERTGSEDGAVERGKDRGPHVGAMLGWGGFLFFVWGVPSIMSGSITAIAIFLGVFLLLVAPGLTTAVVRRNRGEGHGKTGSG